MLKSMHRHTDGFRFECRGRYRRAPERVVVLTQKESSTCDLYLRHRLSKSALPVSYWNFGDPEPPDVAGAFVIIVRYLDRKSRAALMQKRETLSGVALLLDDDLAAAIGDRDLPLHYRLYMAQFWMRYARPLSELASELWLASDVLMGRYASAGNVSRIDPSPEPFVLPRDRLNEESDHVGIFYHAQKTHKVDRLWLYDVIAEAHYACANAHFEIVGGRHIEARYRHLPRVSVRPPVAWPDYLQRSLRDRFDIGLAPLVPTPFNAARSWVKYLDIARFGAVGIFAAGQPYEGVVRDGKNGLLRSAGDRNAWIEALIGLIEDRNLRRELVQGISWPENIETPGSLSRICAA
jgi:hypothetical protein